jgi:hypothetical protein
MARAFRRYPICHRLSIVLTFAYLWDFALHRTKITRTQPTRNHPPWPPYSPILTENVVHAQPPTRGKYYTVWAAIVAVASTCASAPSRHLSGITLDVVGIAGTKRGRSCKEHACCRIFCRTMSLLNFGASRSSCRTPSPKGGKMKEQMAITLN